MSAPSLPQIVRQLRVQLEDERYAPAEVNRCNFLLHAMCVPCWEDACQDHQPGRCLCACQDGRAA